MTKSFRPAKEEDKPDNATESPKKNKKFPNVLPNPLNEFVSCNYVISLGVLNPYEVSRPDDTYIKNGPTTYIIKSGGGNLGYFTVFFQKIILFSKLKHLMSRWVT